MSESTYTDPKVIELSKSFVNVVAHSETTHGSHEAVVVKKAVDDWTKIGRLKGARFRVMSQDGLKKADESGDKALKDALALENVEEKKKALKKIVDDYKGLPVAAQAKKELDALK